MSLGFDPTQDLYKTLGVAAEATPEEIKKAYRRLAKRYHPDSTGGDKGKEARFKDISTAYDVLGNPEKRAQYDAFRTGPQIPSGFDGYPPGGFGSGGGSGGGFDLGDLFSQVFAAGAQGASPGGGFRYNVFRGGSGGAEIPFGTTTRRTRGQKHPRRPRSETTAAESRVRAPDGSVLVRRGNDIHSDVRIAVDQAILGTVVDVPTLSGKASVKIPPGTSSGAKLRLKGKGALDAVGTRGDHYVTIHIDVPRALDDKAKKLLVQFMQRTRKQDS